MSANAHDPMNRPQQEGKRTMRFCFPTVYWHFSGVSYECGDVIAKCTQNDEWNAHLKTSRGLTHDWRPFISSIGPHIHSLPYDGQVSLHFGDPWLNVYEEGDYQEPHNHCIDGNVLSYCYFHKLPPGSGRFGFYNEQYRNWAFSNVIRLDHIQEWLYPTVNEGDLLVFPAFAIHQMTRHSCKEPRVTIAGNLRVRKEQRKSRSESVPTDS